MISRRAHSCGAASIHHLALTAGLLGVAAVVGGSLRDISAAASLELGNALVQATVPDEVTPLPDLGERTRDHPDPRLQPIVDTRSTKLDPEKLLGTSRNAWDAFFGEIYDAETVDERALQAVDRLADQAGAERNRLASARAAEEEVLREEHSATTKELGNRLLEELDALGSSPEETEKGLALRRSFRERRDELDRRLDQEIRNLTSLYVDATSALTMLYVDTRSTILDAGIARIEALLNYEDQPIGYDADPGRPSQQAL